jgi:hypothetical protein
LEADVRKNREMIFKILELLSDNDLQAPLHTACFNLCYGTDDATKSLGDAEITFWKHIFKLDGGFAKELLSKNKPWRNWPTDLHETFYVNREKWIAFLKENASELLADLFR